MLRTFATLTETEQYECLANWLALFNEETSSRITDDTLVQRFLYIYLICYAYQVSCRQSYSAQT